MLIHSFSINLGTSSMVPAKDHHLWRLNTRIVLPNSHVYRLDQMNHSSLNSQLLRCGEEPLDPSAFSKAFKCSDTLYFYIGNHRQLLYKRMPVVGIRSFQHQLADNYFLKSSLRHWFTVNLNLPRKKITKRPLHYFHDILFTNYRRTQLYLAIQDVLRHRWTLLSMQVHILYACRWHVRCIRNTWPPSARAHSSGRVYLRCAFGLLLNLRLSNNRSRGTRHLFHCH